MIFTRAVLLSCLAAMLLLSLWMSGAQDSAMQVESADVVLTLDADAHADDSLEQIALIVDRLSVVFVSHHASYPQQLSPVVMSDSFPPPDRPPAESV